MNENHDIEWIFESTNEGINKMQKNRKTRGSQLFFCGCNGNTDGEFDRLPAFDDKLQRYAKYTNSATVSSAH